MAGNYFPVTTALFIRDERAQLTLLTDRAQVQRSQARAAILHDLPPRSVVVGHKGIIIAKRRKGEKASAVMSKL